MPRPHMESDTESMFLLWIMTYRQTSNISRTLVCDKLVDHSPVGAATTTSSSRLNAWLQWIKQRQLQGETRNIEVLEFGTPYIRGLKVIGCQQVRTPENYTLFNTLGLRQNEWKCMTIDKKWPKIAPNGPINKIPALLLILAWCLSADKALSEPMMVWFTDAYMRHSALMS